MRQTHGSVTVLVAHHVNSPDRLRAAVEDGARWVEVDASAGASGGLAAGHDSGGNGPELGSMLELVAQAGLRVTVDLKCPAQLVAGACEAIAAAGLEDRALVCGHYERPWGEIRAALPGALLGWSTPHPGRWEALLRRGALQRQLAVVAPGMLDEKGLDVLLAHHLLVSERLTGVIHADGRAVHAWTVNRAGRARHLARLGVDAIVTDRPRGIAAGLRPT